jgi:sugar (pentulose or hexulose) kinase
MGSGDNPCTMAGLKLHLGDMAVSLGTSDTLFGPIKSIVPTQDVGSMMCSPLVPDEFMVRKLYMLNDCTGNDMYEEWIFHSPRNSRQVRK